VEPSLAVSMLSLREKSVGASFARLKPTKSVAGKFDTCSREVRRVENGMLGNS
jgi:hypothetical protein